MDLPGIILVYSGFTLPAKPTSSLILDSNGPDDSDTDDSDTDDSDANEPAAAEPTEPINSAEPTATAEWDAGEQHYE